MSSVLSLITQIDQNFLDRNGKGLPTPAGITARAQWLHEAAPYSILAHGTGTDPHFIYANQFALSCFKYNIAELLQLPSRLSAAPQDRSERERLLHDVTLNGIAYHYTGPRVDKYGNTFTIYDGVVWRLTHPDGLPLGQAALFWLQEEERPAWYTGIR
ncbi:MEKHLA domain-containing protein [Chitinophaga polysaccharea]|uniref:MEKHLA domain-containing protein n=1 Tax=Chitinophaga polysaccharea TaxID=1293035 RepID=A0A561PAR1_9BACT|nr:MEKHLA domain-containing protein [Chitinophaga polysaccharea]TWF35215.1 MEKHLA domain-containing protein [Chitinophaga polysaccharea]